MHSNVIWEHADYRGHYNEPSNSMKGKKFLNHVLELVLSLWYTYAKWCKINSMEKNHWKGCLKVLQLLEKWGSVPWIKSLFHPSTEWRVTFGNVLGYISAGSVSSWLILKPDKTPHVSSLQLLIQYIHSHPLYWDTILILNMRNNTE
jgi:hypothetical protein